MGVPCRCNKRSCQARRSLRKRPELYARHPKCHKIGCGGLMYVDGFRLKGRTDSTIHEKDSGKACNDGRCAYPHPHGYGIKGCFYREEHLTAMSLTRGTHKHSPYQPSEIIEETDDAPF